MPRGGARPNSGPSKGTVYKKRRAPTSPSKKFLAELRKADSHAAVRMLGEKLAQDGQYEAAARTIAKIVRYETSPMPTAAREAPPSARQLSLFDAAPAFATPAKLDGEPDEFAGLLN